MVSASTESNREAVRLRPFQSVFATAGAWGLVIGLGVAGLLILVGLSDSAILYWTFIGAAAGLATLWSIYRVALEVDDKEIRVFNVRKTYRVPWESVARVDIVDWWLSPVTLPIGNTALRLTTRLGDRIVLDASTREAPKVCQLLASFQRLRPEIFEC
jgi:hypothetical protein